MPDQVERLTYRVAEAAEALSISRSQAYELIANGSLPACRIGNSWRVPIDELRAWIRTHTQGVQR